jgi:hypothetical protein
MELVTERKRQKPLDNFPMPHLLSFRVTPEQYRGIAFVAETLDVAAAEVLRNAVDLYLRSQTDVKIGRRRYANLLEALQAGEEL